MRRIFTIFIAVLLTACSAVTPAVPTSTALPPRASATLPPNPSPTSGNQATPTAAATATLAPTATIPPTETATAAPTTTPTFTAAQPTPTLGADAPASPAVYSLSGAVWEWTGSDLGGASSQPADPAHYALAFLADGKLAIQDDCVPTSGSYQASDASLKIDAAAPEGAACPPGTLRAEFLDQLRTTSASSCRGLTIALKGPSGPYR